MKTEILSAIIQRLFPLIYSTFSCLRPSSFLDAHSIALYVYETDNGECRLHVYVGDSGMTSCVLGILCDLATFVNVTADDYKNLDFLFIVKEK